DVGMGLRDRELHALVRRDGPAEHAALRGVPRGARDEPASVADRLRRDEDAFGVPRVDDVTEAAALLPDPILRRHDEVAQEDLGRDRSEEHTSELQSRENLVCRLLLEK